MNVEHLKLFTRIAQTHNISQAGQEMGLSPAVASVHIGKLEEGLGVRLIHRTTRQVSLTEEGEAFLMHAQDVLDSVDAARASVGAGKVAPVGTLRISAPASFGRMHLVPALKGFLDRYPQLSVDLRLTDTVVDLVEGGFDVAIRNSNLSDSSLVARQLAADRRIVCAAPAYLAQYGEPKTPQALTKHTCINLMQLEVWCFEPAVGGFSIKPEGKLRTDNGEAVRDACVSGLGIALASYWSVYKHIQRKELMPILTDYPVYSDTALWAVYPSSRLLAHKVRAFIDYFVAYYGSPPYWEVEQ